MFTCESQGTFDDPKVISGFCIGGPEPWQFCDVLKSIDGTELTRCIFTSFILSFKSGSIQLAFIQQLISHHLCTCSSILFNTDATRDFDTAPLQKLQQRLADGSLDQQGNNRRAFTFAETHTFGQQDKSKRLYLKPNLRPNEESDVHGPFHILK